MAKVKVILFTSKVYKNGKSPILLRVTKGKMMKHFKIGDEKFEIEEKQWNKEFGLVKADKRLNPEHEVINGLIRKKLNEAIKILDKYEEKGVAWTFTMFEEEYRHKPKITKVKAFIDNRIIELQQQGKYKSAEGLKESLVIFEKFRPTFDKLYFQDIDYAFIEGYYLYMKNTRKNKDSTIGINLRNIRGILNEAIDKGVGSKENYPFSKIYGATKVFKISRLEKRANKRFIPKEYMKDIVKAEIMEPHLNWARQIFLFSFFASGINFKDMAFLKKEDIVKTIGDDGSVNRHIEFNRKKTNESIRIPLTDQLDEIIVWAKANTTNDNEYLLPIITNKELKAQALNDHVTERRKRLNKHLRTIAKKLEFPDGLLKLSSYYARHSYATTLLRNGASVEKISEALGHTDIKTTQNYLESFGIDEIAKLNADLLK